MFEDGYAGDKGAGIQHARGNITVKNSLFWRNRVGSNNLDEGELVERGSPSPLRAPTPSARTPSSPTLKEALREHKVFRELPLALRWGEGSEEIEDLLSAR